jgi:hypothetical protein
MASDDPQGLDDHKKSFKSLYQQGLAYVRDYISCLMDELRNKDKHQSAWDNDSVTTTLDNIPKIDVRTTFRPPSIRWYQTK